MSACESSLVALDSGQKNYGLAANSSVIYSQWKLVDFKGNTNFKYDVSVEFKADKNEKGFQVLNGKSSINFYLANFKINELKKEISISELIVTQIAGKEEERKFEDDYLKALQEVEKYEIKENLLTLYLSGNTGKNIKFKLSI